MLSDLLYLVAKLQLFPIKKYYFDSFITKNRLFLFFLDAIQ